MGAAWAATDINRVMATNAMCLVFTELSSQIKQAKPATFTYRDQALSQKG
jgi:hypothetical protein